MKTSILAVASVRLGKAGEEQTAVARRPVVNACFSQHQLLEYRQRHHRSLPPLTGAEQQLWWEEYRHTPPDRDRCQVSSFWQMY